MKKTLVIVGILGIADFFAYGINDLTAHNAIFENLTIMIVIAVAVFELFALLYIVDQEEKEQEKRYRKRWLDVEIRRDTLELLYGEDAPCGQNLPATEQMIRRGGASRCLRNS